MYATSIVEQNRTFAKIAFDMYSLGWNTGDFSQFINLLNKVGVHFTNEETDEQVDGRAGYKQITTLIDEKSRQGDRLSLQLLEEKQDGNQVIFTFDYEGMQDGQTINGKRRLTLGVRNAKIISYRLTEL